MRKLIPKSDAIYRNSIIAKLPLLHVLATVQISNKIIPPKSPEYEKPSPINSATIGVQTTVPPPPNFPTVLFINSILCYLNSKKYSSNLSKLMIFYLTKIYIWCPRNPFRFVQSSHIWTMFLKNNFFPASILSKCYIMQVVVVAVFNWRFFFEIYLRFESLARLFITTEF